MATTSMRSDLVVRGRSALHARRRDRSPGARRRARWRRGAAGGLRPAAGRQPQPRRARLPQPGRGDPPRAAHLRRRQLRAGLPALPQRSGRRPCRLQVPTAVARLAGPLASGHRRPPRRAGGGRHGRGGGALAVGPRADRQRLAGNRRLRRCGALADLHRPQRHGARLPPDGRAGGRVRGSRAARGAHRIGVVVRGGWALPRSPAVPSPIRRAPGRGPGRGLAGHTGDAHEGLASRGDRPGGGAVRARLARLQPRGDRRRARRPRSASTHRTTRSGSAGGRAGRRPARRSRTARSTTRRRAQRAPWPRSRR